MMVVLAFVYWVYVCMYVRVNECTHICASYVYGLRVDVGMCDVICYCLP